MGYKCSDIGIYSDDTTYSYPSSCDDDSVVDYCGMATPFDEYSDYDSPTPQPTYSAKPTHSPAPTAAPPTTSSSSDCDDDDDKESGMNVASIIVLIVGLLALVGGIA